MIRPLIYVSGDEVGPGGTGKAASPVNPCPASGHTKKEEVGELVTELVGGTQIYTRVFKRLKNFDRRNCGRKSAQTEHGVVRCGGTIGSGRVFK